MPRIVLPVKDVDQTVLRPVVLQVVREVFAATGLETNTKILFPDSTEVAYQNDSTISSYNNQDEKNYFMHDNLMHIEIEEDYEEDRAISTAVMDRENRYIYQDLLLGAYIKPVYSSSEVHITFRYRAKDRVQALRWRDDIRTRTAMGRKELLHRPTYFYLVPYAGLEILKEIHRLRENVMGYGEDFDTYQKNTFTECFTKASTLAGTEIRDVIGETQGPVLGWFDFNANPERGARDGNGDAWIISFTYHIRFDRPISAVMRYPIVVHNQVLSADYRPNDRSDREDFHAKKFTWSSEALHQFQTMGQIDSYRGKRDGVFVPEYDDFIPSCVIPDTVRVYSALTTIDTETPEVLMNLNHLGEDWMFTDDILDFLKKESVFVHKPYFSVFCLNLYKNENMLEPLDTFVLMNENLDIVLNKAISLRDFFHVRLSLVSNFSLLQPEAKMRLRQNSCILAKLVKAIDPTINTAKILKNLYRCGPVTQAEWDQIVGLINRGLISRGDGQRRLFNTVQGFFIRSHSNKELANASR